MKNFAYSNDDMSAVFTELGYLLHAGIGNADAMTLLAEDETRPAYKAVLEGMAKDADEGLELAEIFNQTGSFPGYVGKMLAVGEKTGRTEEALNALASTCSRRAAMEKRIKSALLYPSILLLIMLAVIAVLLVYVLPIFNTVYAQLGGSLNGVAGSLLYFGQILGKIMPVLIAVFCAAVIFLTLFSTVPSFRDALITRWQKNRGDKGVAGKIASATFAQALSLAMNSGMPIEDAVTGAAELVLDTAGYSERVEKCVSMLCEGKSTSEALKESRLIPASECRILEAGIHGGSGETAMDAIAGRLTEESEEAMDDAISRVEPTMVIITSLLVGLIIISVMLPLINIMSAIG